MLDITDLEPKIEQAAELMTMLSQPMRLRVLCGLAEGERSVGDLALVCGLSQPAMSFHLRKLRDAGIVDTRREGQTIFYRVTSGEVRAVLEVLYRLYCA